MITPTIKISETKKGDFFILAQSTIWAIFPVVAILSYASLPPLVSLGFSTLIAAGFFAVVLTYKRIWKEAWNFKAIKYLFFVALFNGLLYHSLFYLALKYTSAGNASIVGMTEIFFSYMLFNVWKKEFFSWQHVVGSVLMIAGALIVLLPKSGGWNAGDLLVVAAAISAPFGNNFMKKARGMVKSEIVMFIRSAFAVPMIFFVSWAFSEKYSLQQLGGSWFFIIINGLLVLGFSKLLWVEGIHRISVTKANALSSVAPLLTLLFAFLILGQQPVVWQFFAFLPLCAGLIFLTMGDRNKILREHPEFVNP